MLIRGLSAVLLVGLTLASLFFYFDGDAAGRVLSLNESQELVVAARVGPPTYNPEYDDHSLSFEHALLRRFAEHLEKTLKIIPLRSESDVIEAVADGKAHLGVGWFFPVDDPRVTNTSPIHADHLALVQQESSLPIDNVALLRRATIHAAAGSAVATELKRLRDRSPTFSDLKVIERPDGSGLGLFRSVADNEIEFTASARERANVAQNYFPEIAISLALSEPQPIVWITRADAANAVLNLTNDYLATLRADRSLEKMRDVHFAFRRRLNQLDSARFIERVKTTLPRFQGLFKQAQIRTGIDWRLLAALAYQESQWDANATSPTNVRGMMMLTEDTADQLGVSNRLDARESILAGADYLMNLRDELPTSIAEPDRTWLALAAFNIGMGHLRGARSLAPAFKLDPDSWFDMKVMLPKLTRPEVYERLKSGRARGGEAVILVENVRAFHDILSRHAPPYEAGPGEGGTWTATASPTPRLGQRLPANQTAVIRSAPAM